MYLASWPDIEKCPAASGDPTDPCFTTNDQRGGPSTFVPLTNNLVSLNSVGINNVFARLCGTRALDFTA